MTKGQQDYRKVFRSLFDAGILTLAVLACGFVAGWLWAIRCPNSVRTAARWLQIFSGAFFLWSVLGLLGFEIQTYRGETGPEKLNKRVFQVLNCVGMFLLFGSSFALILSKV